MLEVALGRFLDTLLIQADVQPLCVRLLVKGRLLQLALPEEVSPDASAARRSQTTGQLVVTMPKVQQRGCHSVQPSAGLGARQEPPVLPRLPQAAVCWSDGDLGEELPPL